MLTWDRKKLVELRDKGRKDEGLKLKEIMQAERQGMVIRVEESRGKIKRRMSRNEVNNGE